MTNTPPAFHVCQCQSEISIAPGIDITAQLGATVVLLSTAAAAAAAAAEAAGAAGEDADEDGEAE